MKLSEHAETLRKLADELNGDGYSYLPEEAKAAADALDAAQAEIEQLRKIVTGIANAKRFDREVFADDAAFVDWAQSLCRHASTTTHPLSAQEKI